MNKSSRNTTNDLPDLAEPFFDEASTKVANALFHQALPELAKDIPVLKYIKTGVDLYSIYKTNKLYKKMRAFLKSLIDSEFDIETYNLLEQGEKEAMIDILVTELDNQTDDLQSEALGLLFVAYIERKIDRLMFMGIAHELKNTNPLAFYFSVDSISVTEMYKDKELALKGPVHYLPSSFYSDEASGFLSTSDGPFLTNLGRAFYEHVYKPMAERHVI